MSKVTAAPANYTPTIGVLPDPAGTGIANGFKASATTLRATNAFLPQVATVAPRNPPDGAQRLARAPWRPIGGTADVWVYWDEPSASWKAL